MKRVYMDHNATTATHPEVLKAMLPYFGEIYGNASSFHGFGMEANKALEDSREMVAKVWNASPREIYFTSGGTESDNAAIKGVAFANQDRGKHIITSSIEHHAVLHTCQYLQKRFGFDVTYLPVDGEGFVDPDDLRRAIRKDTILISIMHANNETGVIQPIEEIGRIAKENGIPFHSDAVQTTGKIPIDVNALNVDLLSASGHKLYGPKGVGALYIRRGVRIDTFMHGGHQERGKRAGTYNTPGIVGMAKAVEIALRDMDEESRKMRELTEKLYEGLRDRIPHIRLNGSLKNRLPNTINVSIEYVEGESMILNLDMKGVAVSTGSACTSGSLEPSHVLVAMGVPPEVAHGSLRFSLGRENTLEDVNYVLEVLPPIVEKLRAMSPLYSSAASK
ncbi:MAG: cysteine desulfurase NifS [bacterium]